MNSIWSTCVNVFVYQKFEFIHNRNYPSRSTDRKDNSTSNMNSDSNDGNDEIIDINNDLEFNEDVELNQKLGMHLFHTQWHAEIERDNRFSNMIIREENVYGRIGRMQMMRRNREYLYLSIFG